MKYYESMSMGVIPIKEMNSHHLVNAIRKLEQTVVIKIENAQKTYVNGNTLPVYKDLTDELSIRSKPKVYIMEKSL